MSEDTRTRVRVSTRNFTINDHLHSLHLLACDHWCTHTDGRGGSSLFVGRNVVWCDQQEVLPITQHGKNVPPPKSPYAIAFVLGAINEAQPSYKGFVYSTLVSARILRRLGSTSDFHVFARLSPESNLTALPEEDQRVFAGYNISVTLLQP